MKMAVCWFVAPCSLEEVYRRFGAIALMMEAANTSETLENFYQTVRHNNPEDSHLQTLRRENMKYQIIERSTKPTVFYWKGCAAYTALFCVWWRECYVISQHV
jgi:hypothetical protein